MKKNYEMYESSHEICDAVPTPKAYNKTIMDSKHFPGYGVKVCKALWW